MGVGGRQCGSMIKGWLFVVHSCGIIWSWSSAACDTPIRPLDAPCGIFIQVRAVISKTTIQTTPHVLASFLLPL